MTRLLELLRAAKNNARLKKAVKFQDVLRDAASLLTILLLTPRSRIAWSACRPDRKLT